MFPAAQNKNKISTRNLYSVTASSIAKALEMESEPDGIYVLVAKHRVMGLDREQVADLLGVTVGDVVEVESTGVYGQIKDYCAHVYAEQISNQASGWDAIESLATDGLIQRLNNGERDPDFLLRVAAVANKATRKVGKESDQVLDPALRAGRTTLVLTQRIIQKLADGKTESLQVDRALSIRDGSMVNPTFKEIDSLLGVKGGPILSKELEVKYETPQELSVDEMVEEWLQK